MSAMAGGHAVISRNLLTEERRVEESRHALLADAQLGSTDDLGAAKEVDNGVLSDNNRIMAWLPRRRLQLVHHCGRFWKEAAELS